jgi:hypothetical protein
MPLASPDHHLCSHPACSYVASSSVSRHCHKLQSTEMVCLQHADSIHSSTDPSNQEWQEGRPPIHWCPPRQAALQSCGLAAAGMHVPTLSPSNGRSQSRWADLGQMNCLSTPAGACSKAVPWYCLSHRNLWLKFKVQLRRSSFPLTLIESWSLRRTSSRKFHWRPTAPDSAHYNVAVTLVLTASPHPFGLSCRDLRRAGAKMRRGRALAWLAWLAVAVAALRGEHITSTHQAAGHDPGRTAGTCREMSPD